MAGIALIPAILLSCQGSEPPATKAPSPALLERISRAPWAEPRHYEDLPENDRFRQIREDLAFDAWVAQKARAQGIELDPRESEQISLWSSQVEYAAVRDALAARLEVTEQEIQDESQKRGWTAPLPERWEISHLFVDRSLAETESEREQLHQRALWLREQLTPENFREMAHLWSDAPSSDEGGNLRAIQLKDVEPARAAQIRSTTPGTISGPHETASGWNLIYVRSHRPAAPRDLTPEQLREMTAQVIADAQARQARQSPESWQSLFEELSAAEKSLLEQERTALENFLLARRYIYREASHEAPTEEQLQAIYEERQEQFTSPPSRKAREILVSSEDWTLDRSEESWRKRRAARDQAREIRQRILDGEDFAALARRYSASRTASTGGELGWIQEPSHPQIDTALAALQGGQVSPPIATNKGYLLLQLLEEQPRATRPYEESRAQCETIWRARQLKQVEEELREQFLKEAFPRDRME